MEPSETCARTPPVTFLLSVYGLLVHQPLVSREEGLSPILV